MTYQPQRMIKLLSVGIVATFIGGLTPGIAVASGGSGVSWGGELSIFEQDPPTVIDTDGLEISGASLDGGYIDFAIDGQDGSDLLSLTSSEVASTLLNEVTVVDGSVFVGDGTTAVNIGSIDDTRTGLDGNPLRVNFLNSFPNASFEQNEVGDTDVIGWTEYTQQIVLGPTSTPGLSQFTVDGWGLEDNRTYGDICANGTNANDDVFDTSSAGWTTTFSVSVEQDAQRIAANGDKALRLFFSGVQSGGRGWVVHGPAAASSTFQAAANDVITFAWRSQQASDHAVAYGVLLNVDTGNQYELLEYVSGLSTSWADKSFTIPAPGNYKFIFIAGSNNRDCLAAGSSTLWIDNVRVVGEKVSADVATAVARLVTYANTSDNPPLSRTVTLSAVRADGTTVGSATATVDITPVNDPPSVTGSITITETSSRTFDPVEGNLVATDPDEDNPTFTFGVVDGVVAGENLVEKVGSFGTLQVNTVTGAFIYAPNAEAIKPLDTGNVVTDEIQLIVSDGQLEGAGTFRATINGFTDTEPSPPLILTVVPGDGFGSIFFEAPLSSGTTALQNYEYAINGGTFRAFDPATTSSPVEITTLSVDGASSLINGQEYSVTLRAVNGGEVPSDPSNTVVFTPQASPEVNSPNIPTLGPDQGFEPISEDFVVSGFSRSDSLLVTIGLSGHSSGTEFRLPNFGTSGAEVGAGFPSYGGTGVIELAITGTQSEVNAALRGLELKTGSGSTDFQLNVSASISNSNIVQSGVTQSFYEFVPETGVTWQQARDRASQRTYLGLTGYLATITSAEENQFVANRIPNAQNVWVGASDGAVEGDWRWVTGPEGQNGGTRFWRNPDGVQLGGPNAATRYDAPDRTGSGNQACTPTGTGITGSVDPFLVTYACWAAGEPNNADSSRGGEHAVVTNWNNSPGFWNDLAASNTSQIGGYLVEYSAWGDQQIDSTALAKSSVTVSMGGPRLVVTPIVNGLVAEWTTPSRPGQTVESFEISVVPGIDDLSACAGPETSCTLVGLPAGTEYTLRVTAIWSDNVETISALVSSRPLATPAVAPPPLPQTPVVRPRPELVIPVQPVSAPQNVFQPAAAPAPAPITGPVLRGNVVPTAPQQPVARVGTRDIPVTTQVNTPNRLDVRASSVSLGVSIPQTVGGVRQQPGGSTELEVRSGGQTTLQGGGVLPGSTVQVFMPLQGTNAKQVAQIQADATGAFNGDAVFATQRTEPPLPIGRQVLQIVSVDDTGQQVVMEMAVVIAQPPPAPEFDRSVDALPTLLPGQSIATEAGLPVAVQVRAETDNRQAVIEADGWTMAIAVAGQDASVEETPEGGASLTFVRDETASVQGSGFMPGTRADVWLFSEPTLLGTVTIDDNGEFNGEISVDGRTVTVGEHTLQLQGVGSDGYVRSANLGVVVKDADAEVATTADVAASFAWWFWIIGLVALLVVAAIAFWVYRRASAAV